MAAREEFVLNGNSAKGNVTMDPYVRYNVRVNHIILLFLFSPVFLQYMKNNNLGGTWVIALCPFASAILVGDDICQCEAAKRFYMEENPAGDLFLLCSLVVFFSKIQCSYSGDCL